MDSRVSVFGKIVGILCIASSLTLLPPIGISLWFHDGELPDFITTFLALFLLGAILGLAFRKKIHSLHRRDGFLIVATFWIILSLFSSLPLALGPHHLSMVDSIFEATSGITTTGATIITDLDQIAPSILFYRQELQWIGGMGLIVLAIAVLPVLGIGGMNLYRAETPGPMKDNRITPRLTQTARNLWLIYITLTISCAAAYWLVGLTPLDALELSFSTISTGGFSTHDESLAYFHNKALDIICVIFMIAGGINFGVHFLAIRNRNPLQYLADIEVRSYLMIMFTLVLIFFLFLYFSHTYQDVFSTITYSLFEVTSIMTSTGFGVTDFTLWPLFLPALLIFISFIGGCGGSTAGGIKIIRVLTLFKQAIHEVFMLLHPKAIRPVRIGNSILDDKTTQAIWGFFALYILVFVVLTLCMMLAGLDQVSAFAAVASCINNLGPGLGEVSTTFAHISDTAKLIAVVAMLLGRLEIFTLLIILMPEFWRS